MASEEHAPGGGTITIGGKKVKKSTAGVVGLLAVVVVIVAIRKKSAAAAAPAAGAFTDPGGNTCAAPNPATGYCPGTPQDIAATEQLSAASQSSGLNIAPAPDLGGGGSSGIGSSVPTFTDNGSWGQYVEQALGSDGTDATAAAIAKYLNGSGLTTQQATTVEQAIAIANSPPVAGPGGFPPSMKMVAAAPTPPPPAANVTVPHVVGQRADAAITAIQHAGLVAHISQARKPGLEYLVNSQTPAGGAKAAKGSTVDLGVKTGK